MALPNDERLPFPHLDTEPQAVRQRVEAMEKILERLFVIPGINRPVGLDAILDLIPASATSPQPRLAPISSGRPATLACRNGNSPAWPERRIELVARPMLVVPVVGVIPTLLFRSNTKNLKMIKRHLDKHHAGTATIEGQLARTD